MTTLPPEPAAKSSQIADREAVQRLLNTWLRETGIADPRISRSELLRRFPSLADALPDGQAAFMVQLEPDLSAIIGLLTAYSPTGLHSYADALWVWRADTGRLEPLGDAKQLASYLTAAMVTREGAGNEVDAAVFRERIEDGIERSRLYIAHALNGKSDGLDPTAEKPMGAAEQALRFGHPFHPMAKSAQDFDGADLHRYAPELGAGFPLFFLAADRRHVRQQFLDAHYEARTDALLRELAGPVAKALDPDRCLIPCHPWQARYLRRHPSAAMLLERGVLVDLGAGREPVFPTSSVRTVWCPGIGLFLKLALNVRITNFLRVNPPEQLRRSIDAARAVKAALPEGTCGSLHVLPEWGYRTVRCEGMPTGDAEALAASLGYLIREAPSGAMAGRPMVVAALLEMGLCSGQPAILKALRRTAERAGRPLDGALVGDWMARYVETFLLPALRLFADTGISLEAHVQNSLIVLDEGWPEAVFVRDLEGASIARVIGERAGILTGLADDSPALYETEEAWHRFKYYAVVNHLGHLTAVLGHFGPADETMLWRRVRSVLAQARLDLGEAACAYLDDLLGAATLPAKANLLSCFRRRGERPLYVDIPNPLAKKVRA